MSNRCLGVGAAPGSIFCAHQFYYAFGPSLKGDMSLKPNETWHLHRRRHDEESLPIVNLLNLLRVVFLVRPGPLSVWPPLQILVVKKFEFLFEVLFQIAGAKL